MNTNKTTIQDFNFEYSSHGHYKVTFTSPRTGKQWTKTINDMTLIDRTKNSDDPKRKDIEILKATVKNWK